MDAPRNALEQLAINTIRTLSMDGVQRANSGHPGTPMALAPVAYALWQHVLRFDPAAPQWPARDRFVLSCGHASMLLYAVLHLAGVRKVDAQGQLLDAPAISLADLQNFRQWHSPCAGHPEYGEAAGIEMTTGPLGQGVATSVGMAMAAQWLAARYDRPDFPLFGYDVYALCSDGDLMEGVAAEAASLAGHLKLPNLCWIYDDNAITIEGSTALALSENVARRFEGLGWRTLSVADANDVPALLAAFEQFRAHRERPTLILVKSIIAYGAPNKANTAAAHGAPLGESEVRLAKAALGWPADATFHVPPEVTEHFAQGLGQRGRALCETWQTQLDRYRQAYPEPARELQQMWRGELPDGWEQGLPAFEANARGLATRTTSGQVLNRLAAHIPWLIGGSADLAPSNMTLLTDVAAGHFQAGQYGGRNLHFGVREHAMAAACNGLALSGLRPYCGTFFVFTDYMRPAMRLASLMRLGVLYVLTHDSIGLGEDGPTHQPVEHLAACRCIPRLLVFRPADANEVAQCYRVALQRPRQPAALVLTRQNLPTLDRTRYGAATGAARGGYVLCDPPDAPPQVILIGTGSEVAICLAAQELLAARQIPARVVSLPCFALFDAQDAEYRESVLPSAVTARVGVEAALIQGWEKYLGPAGRFVGLQDFGASAPFEKLYAQFGLTPAAVAEQACAALGDSARAAS
ncbi:MAG: transketolase [Pirellulaceae bacterium]|jgi:transketolase|nr:transketolase [Pirellulaceae bacterium]